MAQVARAQRNEHGLRPRQYILIGLVLTVITVIELAVSYSGMPHMAMTLVLIALSALKFAMVVAFFMHLRFESSLLTRLFVLCFALATAVVFSLLALFGSDLQ